MSPISVAIYQIEGHTRSNTICNAMECGIKSVGDIPKCIMESRYRGPEADVAVFYGYVGNLPKAMKEYTAEGRHVVYVDLGYWGRLLGGGRWYGYHKISVNARHPTAYFQRRKHSSDRATLLGITPQPWCTGKHILLAGMGPKSAKVEGLELAQWERDAVLEIKRHTDRRIVYRPKPSWRNAEPIEGADFSHCSQDVGDVLQDCHAVVTHHSNAAVDGLVQGVPAFCWHGVAQPMSLQDISRIDDPWRPEGREQWIADIAWTQFNVDEMKEGVPWRHLKNDGLIP